MEVIGEYVNLLGSRWAGRMSEEEKSTIYKCIIRDFEALHKHPDGSMGQAFQVHANSAIYMVVRFSVDGRCKKWGHKARGAWSMVTLVVTHSGSNIQSRS
jgi:hypothetical protein